MDGPFPGFCGVATMVPANARRSDSNIRTRSAGTFANVRIKGPRAVRRDHSRSRSLLQLALQRLDLFGQCGAPGDQGLDLAYGVQHRGVVAPAEAAADLRQGAQGER